MAQTQVVTLQSILNSASAALGETGGTPTAELTTRIRFANDCKEMLANMRNWGYELKTGTINITTVNNYALPTDFKNETAMESVKIKDSNGNYAYYAVATEDQWNYITVNNMNDQVFYVTGDQVAGFTLYVNLPTPITAVTSGITIRYYSTEVDFVNVTDTTRIPSSEVLHDFIVAQVLYGYREQAQYQLAMQEFEDALEDMVSTDYKKPPHASQRIIPFKESIGADGSFKSNF